MMPQEITIAFKNVIMEGAVDDGTLSFDFKSGGDMVITMDVDTFDKIAEMLEEEVAVA